MKIKTTINIEPTMKLIDKFFTARIKYVAVLNQKLEEHYKKSYINNKEFPHHIKGGWINERISNSNL